MQAQDGVMVARVRAAHGVGYWSVVAFLVAVILGACGVTASKAYRNHAGYVGVANDDPERAVEWTLGERVWQFLTRARRAVTPTVATAEGADGMAYYLYRIEVDPPPTPIYIWGLWDVVDPFVSGQAYRTIADSPTGAWSTSTGDSPAPTLTASGSGYLVSGAGTTAYNGQYNPNGATCNGEAVYELGYGPSPKWNWPAPVLIHGGWTFGEESPEYPEIASKWSDWSNGAGGAVTVSGDGDWGKLQLGTGQVAHSPVKDFVALQVAREVGDINLIGLVRYGDTPVGGMDVYWRESDTEFGQDDGSPAWTQVVVTPATSPQTMPMTKRYRQIKLVGQ